MSWQTWISGVFVAGLCVVSLVSGDEKPGGKPSGKAASAQTGKAGAEHSAMLKEHRQAHEEHDAALTQLGRWRVEHRKALAAIASIQARIYEHDAAIEELAEHARLHEDHIRHHEEEIHEHERSGDAGAHEQLSELHQKLLSEHKKFQEAMHHVEDDHSRLMKELHRLAESLKAEK